jgi:hypothetical protein
VKSAGSGKISITYAIEPVLRKIRKNIKARVM